MDVATLVADGCTNEEIAERLHISKRTVTTHLTNIYARFGLRSRVELANMVRSSGSASTYPSNGTNT